MRTSSARCRPTLRSASPRSGKPRCGLRVSCGKQATGSIHSRQAVQQQAPPCKHATGIGEPQICQPAWTRHFGLSTCPMQVVDAAVLRFPRAVTHFSPGSAKWRPTQACAAGPGEMACCGSTGWCSLRFGPAVHRLPLQHPTLSCSPDVPQETSFGNLWLAGDWVKGVQHGANGLSQASRRRCRWFYSSACPADC